MRLSISSSRHTTTTAHVAALVAACVLFCISVEALARQFFPLFSHIEGRHEAEYRGMLSIRKTNRVSILLAGNSLLLHGVEFSQLQQQLQPNIEIRRAAMENTSYLDWFYGLRRILNAGARPDVVVLVLTPRQLISNGIDGDYTVHMMVDGRDLLRVAKDVGADRNRLSVFALDKLSFFFGTRAEIRNMILQRVLPDLGHLTQYLQPAPPALDDKVLGRSAASRLHALRQLCKRYDVSFVLVIPPATTDSGVSAVVQAAAAERVPVLIPIKPGILRPGDYSDGFHLSSSGALKFTPLLASDLKKIVKASARNNVASVSLETHLGP